jgi:hypothetical protein
MQRKNILWIGFAAAILIAASAQAALAGEVSAPAGKVDAKAAFEKLKGLAGEWQGKAGEEGMPATVTYRVTSNGSVVMETLMPGTDHEMITMYHMAGNELVATHYCSAGNQPHLKLDSEKSTPTQLVFAFDGGTNIDPAKDGHIHQGQINLGADGQLESIWTFYAGGQKARSMDFHLTRVAAK